MPKYSLLSHPPPLLLGLYAFCLLSIWTLPETIAWRHVLLGLGGFFSISLLINQLPLLLSKNAWPVWMLLGLYLWLTLHLCLFSSQKIQQLEELLSIWARSLAALPLGLAVGMFLGFPDPAGLKQGNPSKNVITALLFLGFLSTPLIFIGFYLHECYLAHEWLGITARNWWELPYLQKPPFVVATALLLPICCAFFIQTYRGAMKIWWFFLGMVAIALCVATDYLTNTKNGMAMVALTIGIFSIYLLRELTVQMAFQSLGKTALILILSTILVVGTSWGIKLHLEKNPAWANLLSNIKIGRDIEHNNYWKNRNIYPIPINDLGNVIDISTYERTAWFTAGLLILKEKPQGFGLIDHSFGWMARERWPDFYEPVGSLRGMTHSGWLDLALGIGIPGILLILIPLWAAWYRSLSRHDLWGTYTTLCIPIFFICYLTTEVTGAHHFIELLMFMTAFFVGITLTPLDRTKDTQIT